MVQQKGPDDVSRESESEGGAGGAAGGFAQEFPRTVRRGAAVAGVAGEGRAVCLLQPAAQPGEGAVLRRHGLLGLDEAPGEGHVQLAEKRGREARKDALEAGSAGLAARRSGPARRAIARVVRALKNS